MFDIEKFIEVPNTGVREPVLANQFADELCLSIADDYGYAEVVWYALMAIVTGKLFNVEHNLKEM